MTDKATQVQFANVPYFRPRRQIELKNRGLVVNASNEADVRGEVFLRHSVTGINVEPIVGIRQAAAQGRVVAVQTGGPGLGVISAQIQIAEQNELGIDAAGTVIRIERIA